ncbi:MAG TPA: energy transducer TonB [Opitutaceae bacterium]|nr:energy transducer TonB [Opitutaceae bacterium]
MNAKTLILACVATVVLSGPVVAADSAYPPSATARVTKVIEVAGTDRAPVVLKAVIPQYPWKLRRDGIEGIATVDMQVDSSGRVVSAELVRATTPEFGRLALAAAKEWTFVPASANGKPTTMRVRVPFSFTTPELVAMGNR